MDKQKLIKQLKDLQNSDPESGHYDADRILLEFINDEEVTEAFDGIHKWYA